MLSCCTVRLPFFCARVCVFADDCRVVQQIISVIDRKKKMQLIAYRTLVQHTHNNKNTVKSNKRKTLKCQANEIRANGQTTMTIDDNNDINRNRRRRRLKPLLSPPPCNNFSHATESYQERVQYNVSSCIFLYLDWLPFCWISFCKRFLLFSFHQREDVRSWMCVCVCNVNGVCLGMYDILMIIFFHCLLRGKWNTNSFRDSLKTKGDSTRENQ